MSRLRTRNRSVCLLLAVLAAQLLAEETRAQVEVEAFLFGRVFVGDAAMQSGTVVLHRVSDTQQGQIDSARVASDGTFSLRLSSLPNPALGDIYIGSVQHQGVMYFGPALTEASALDSLYVIQAYDTMLAPLEGLPVPVQERYVFMDPQGDGWIVTDLFRLQNDSDRTIVARPGGRVWTYPLPDQAVEVTTGEGDLSADVITYEFDSLVVRGAIPPGEREFVVRYTLATIEVSLPTPGSMAYFNVLVREPAPPLEVTGLDPAESVELEGGATYRRFVGENVAAPTVQVALGEEVRPPAVHWIAVILAGLLAAGGIFAFSSTARTGAPARSPELRQDLVLEVARLDDEYEQQPSPSEADTKAYQVRRAQLIRRLREGA